MSLPCYAVRHWTQRIKNKKIILDSLNQSINSYAARDNRCQGIIVVSLTEKDPNWKEYLEVIEGYNNVAITTTQSKLHGTYQCWMCCIPVFENLGREE